MRLPVMARKKGTKGGRNTHPDLRELGKPLVCPFAMHDGGRSRRETFSPAYLRPSRAGEWLPWISADGRALEALPPCLGIVWGEG